MGKGKIVELYLVNGTADSLVRAELSNWDGKAYKIPRNEAKEKFYKEFDDGAIDSAGVYFLFCKNEETDEDSVYIGESEQVLTRLLQHIKSYEDEKEEFYWTTAVAFIGNDLDKAKIRHLENKLCIMTKAIGRYSLLTKSSSETVLKNSHKDVLDEFIDNIKIIINALGYKVLEPKVKTQQITTTEENGRREEESIPDNSNLWSLSSGKYSGEGIQTADGFVLLKGAHISDKESPTLFDAYREKRRKSIATGKVVNFITTEDIEFSSPSAAANFILGYRVSGPAQWKDSNGISMKDK